MNKNGVTVMAIAMMCHAANKALCESIGDYSQRNWELAEDWQKQSAITGVIFRLENPDGPASAQHDAWMKEKQEQGWVYGEVKDANLKTHPCMVPYEQLPLMQQKKDELFTAIVESMRNAVVEEPHSVTTRPLTYGEMAVGLTFNPGGMPEVNRIKRLLADSIDELHDQRKKAKADNNSEKIAQYTIAIRDLMAGQMMGVKAATWQYSNESFV